MNHNEKSRIGQDAALGETSTGGADWGNHILNSDYWGAKDHHRMCADANDLLQFAIDQYGINESTGLVKAVNFIKRSSEHQAFKKGVDHG